MEHACGCEGNPLVQGLESAGRAQTLRDALALLGWTAGSLVIGGSAYAAPEYKPCADGSDSETN